MHILPSSAAGLCGLVLALAHLAGLHPAHAQDRPKPAAAGAPAASIELPLIAGWFQGKEVLYITTDVSDREAAKDMDANFVPRLAHAIPSLPRAPGQASAVERIYSVANFKQGSVLPSLPDPTGAGNADRNYSPLWLVHKVHWLPGHPPRVLRSEEEILAAAEQGQVTITQTNIVVNCPVIFSPQGGLLPHAKIIRPAPSDQ